MEGIRMERGKNGRDMNGRNQNGKEYEWKG
jgi:hypothetical protein